MRSLTCVWVVLGCVSAAWARAAPEEAEAERPLAPAVEPLAVMTEALALVLPGGGTRSLIHRDLLQLAYVKGTPSFPEAAGECEMPELGKVTWTKAEVTPEGGIVVPGGATGYLVWRVQVPTACTALLDASGHQFVIAQGERRMGDPYGTGEVSVPVALEAGTNTFVFRTGRGAVRAQLLPASGLCLDERDKTLPSLIVGAQGAAWGGVIVHNPTREPARGLSLVADSGDPAKRLSTPVRTLPPLSSTKVPFELPLGAVESGKVRGAVELVQADGAVAARIELNLNARRPDQLQRRTFTSEIDGSVQYYALQPSEGESTSPRALFLSLHGAGVEGQGQAGSYASKSWGHVVSPTNRRPFGFDWEDWGRRDALEVLDLAARDLATDPTRVHVTGHSMGGHGTWHLGVTYPDRFAAIAPSAGWASFWSYGGRGAASAPSSTPSGLLRRASSASDTFTLATNLVGVGVYVLHGDADDNVPVSEARAMRERLASFHRDLDWHEQVGAGHWWDNGPEPGAACVDWPPLFDFFARRCRPIEVTSVDFTTACPGISASRSWLTIEAQVRDFEFSRAMISVEPRRRHFRGTTSNIARMTLDLAMMRSPGEITLDLDGAPLVAAWPESGARLFLERHPETGAWATSVPLDRAHKGPHRYGPFRTVFDHRALLVYGTKGGPEENAWAYARARYDAEVFWVRGNGSFTLMSDADFLAEAARDPSRNVVLYGNSETNAAWPSLLGASSVQVTRQAVTLGDKSLAGDDLAVLFIQPRPGSDETLVGAVSGTGLPGMRVTDGLPLFISGVGIPDLVVLSSSMLRDGDAGVLAAGFFGRDWQLATGELVTAADR